MNETQSNYDGAWKEALEQYFAEFMAFFFPAAYADIDIARGYEFLDKELQQVARDAELGQRRVDKLAQVWLKNGREKWVLVHIEVQSQEEAAFAERMYVYNYRLFDRYHRCVASMAVLGDERAGWEPNRYERELWECRTTFTFPTVKLLDYKKKWDTLEKSNNPFATVVMAHLKAQETHHDDDERKKWKLYLMRRLYERGYERDDIINLFRFIDWVIKLPETAEDEIWQEIQQYEEAKQMTYITSVERIGFKRGKQAGIQEGIQKGIQKGIQEGIQKGAQRELLAGIELGLELKFGSAGLRLLPEIRKIKDVDVLRAIREGLKTVTTTEELRYIYQ